MTDFTCNTNYLQPTGFKITISKENYPYLSFFAQSIQHPSLEVEPVELGYKRLSNMPFIGEKITNGQVVIEALLDEEMGIYQEVYNWLNRMVEEPHQLNTSLTESGQIPDYCDMRIEILTSSNNKNRTIKYVNSFPVSLGDIQMAATNEDTYLTLPLTFRFDYFDFL